MNYYLKCALAGLAIGVGINGWTLNSTEIQIPRNQQRVESQIFLDYNQQQVNTIPSNVTFLSYENAHCDKYHSEKQFTYKRMGENDQDFHFSLRKGSSEDIMDTLAISIALRKDYGRSLVDIFYAPECTFPGFDQLNYLNLIKNLSTVISDRTQSLESYCMLQGEDSGCALKRIKEAEQDSQLYKAIWVLFVMVSGRLKSRSLRRVKVRTPSGNTVTHHRQRNRSANKCAVTKKPLQGIPRLTSRKFKNLNKSQKTVSRPYGGYMSHVALKNKILEEMVLNQEE